VRDEGAPALGTTSATAAGALAPPAATAVPAVSEALRAARSVLAAAGRLPAGEQVDAFARVHGLLHEALAMATDAGTPTPSAAGAAAAGSPDAPATGR